MTQRRHELSYVALASILAVFAVSALWTLPPAPVVAEAPPTVFSADRAFAHVQALAREVHPTGSPANDAAREYLVTTLEAWGFTVELQEGSVLLSPGRTPDWYEAEFVDGRAVLPLSNVLVRLAGRGDGGVVLVQAHYDSTRRAPGAGDNAVGVAALMETLRSLALEGPFRNDVIFHFDDGEEISLLGAELFLEEHRWASEVDALLNFDARGNAGPPICFEVGPNSAPLIAALSGSLSRPLASSAAAAVYARMPNDTSFSPFRRAGVPGLNFAFVGGATAYHRPIDRPENLSRRTLQRQGELCLAITRAAAEMDLDALEDGRDAAFFNFGDGRLIHYPLGWSYPLALLPLGLIGGYLVRLRRRGARLIPGLGRALVFFLVVSGGAYLSWWAVDGVVGWASSLFGLFEGEGRGNLLSASLQGFGTMAAALTVALVLLERRRRSAPDVRRSAAGGGPLAWALLLVLFLAWMPAAAYLFLWPAVFALPFHLGRGDAEPRAGTLILGLVSFALAVSALAPIVYLLILVGSIEPGRAPLIAALLAGCMALLLQPHLGLALSRRAHGSAVVCGVLTLAILLAGSLAAAGGL